MKKILYILFVIILLAQISSASILTSSANPAKIFKCGESTISVSFDDAGVTSSNATLIPTGAVQPMVVGRAGQNMPEMAQSVVVPLTFNGTYWVGTFGDNPNMLWGTRSITYDVNGVTTYPSSTTVFVYNSGSTCTGTGKNSFTNYTTGIGFYTNLLVSGAVPPEQWWLYPWLQYLGYMFYVALLFTVVSVVYLKTQNVMPAIFTLIFSLLALSVSGVIPYAFRMPIVSLMALLIAAVFYRLFTRD